MNTDQRVHTHMNRDSAEALVEGVRGGCATQPRERERESRERGCGLDKVTGVDAAACTLDISPLRRLDMKQGGARLVW
jgi:hypothetical protein